MFFVLFIDIEILKANIFQYFYNLNIGLLINF